MPKFIDITGQRFGHLTALKEAGRTAQGKALWLCRCDYDSNLTIVTSNHLRSGHTQSCGCQERGNGNLQHGHTKTRSLSPTYVSWRGMFDRCYNKKNKSFKNYGAHGVTVCKRWHKFENFLADMGLRPPGRTLDRINPYGNYTPSNCRWATRLQQRHNRR
jgi:hypothetical protein